MGFHSRIRSWRKIKLSRITVRSRIKGSIHLSFPGTITLHNKDAEASGGLIAPLTHDASPTQYQKILEFSILVFHLQGPTIYDYSSETCFRRDSPRPRCGYAWHVLSVDRTKCLSILDGLFSCRKSAWYAWGVSGPFVLIHFRLPLMVFRSVEWLSRLTPPLPSNFCAF